MDSIKLCCTTYSTKRWAKGTIVNSEIERMERPSSTGWFYAIIIKQTAKAGLTNPWHACPNWHAAYSAVSIVFNLFFSDQRLYIVTSQSLYMNYRCYQITLRVKLFYTDLERCEMLTGYLSFGVPAWRWHYTRRFNSLLFKQEIVAAPGTSTLSALLWI